MNLKIPTSIALMLVLLSILLSGCASTPASSLPTTTRQDSPSSSPPGVGLEVGQRAPDFQVRTLDGSLLTSEMVLSQKRPFILFFFATW